MGIVGMVQDMYARIVRVHGSNLSLYIRCKFFVAPVGEKVFAILGEDRILYTAIDNDIGKEYAVRVVKGSGWNIVKVRVGKAGKIAQYTIPKSFAKQLNINDGDLVIVLGKDDALEVIPLVLATEKIGKFKELLLYP